jgi:amino acid adenylation domain-containing protein
MRLLHEPLFRNAAERSDHPAVIAEERTLTYGELAAAARSLAVWFRSRGLSRGDRVAVYVGNYVETAIAIYGALAAGCAFVTIHCQTKQQKLAQILADCEPAAIVLAPELAETVAAASGGCASVRTALITGGDKDEMTSRGVSALSAAGLPAAGFTRAGGSGPELQTVRSASAAASGPEEPVIPLDLAALIYTSGSTGEPKGAMMTHQAMVFAALSIIEYLGMQPDDRIINFLPLSFDYGLYQLLMTVTLGATLVLQESASYPGRIINAVRTHSVTVFPGVPTVFAVLVSMFKRSGLSLPEVRTVTNTAAALSDALLPDLRRIFPNARIFKMYGLTECKRVSYLDPALLEDKPGSVGKAIPGTEVFLRAPDGKDVAPGELGILHVRGTHVMLGYWNRPDETAQMLLPGRYPGERILRTGDWFRMDAEGFLYFYGRSDDIIKSRGEKVSPAEVEEAIRSMEGVEDTAVVGIPDEVVGEAIAAYVVKRPGVEISERAVRSHCAGLLEEFKIPRTVYFTHALPKTASGKVKKQALRTPDP